MSVVEALRKTSKGQLPYERCLIPSKLNNDLEKYSSPPLSGPHKEREYSLLNLSFGLDPLNFSNESVSPSSDPANISSRKDLNVSRNNANNSFVPSTFRKKRTEGQKMTITQALEDLDLEITKEYDESGKLSWQDPEPPAPSPSSSSSSHGSRSPRESTGPCPRLTRFGLTSHAISEEEESWTQMTKQVMRERWRQFENFEEGMKVLMEQKKKELSKKIRDLVNQRESLIEQSQQESKLRAHERLQKLKEGYEEHQKKIFTKHQEIERQREKLEEEEKKRQEEEQAKLRQLQALFKDFEEHRNLFAKLKADFELKGKLPEVVGKCQADLDATHSTLREQLAESEQRQSVPADHYANFQRERDQCVQKVELLKRQIEVVRKAMQDNEMKAKEEEQKKIAAAKQEEEKKKAEKELDFSIQSMAFVLKEKESKQKVLADVTPVVQAFVANAQMKKFRFDLQRGVNTPINAISAVSGSHLRDKLQALHSLLSGQSVQVAGKQVSAGQSPEGMTFCQNLIAKMLVKKAEEQVTSNHESAFAIAAVAVGLWIEFPVVGDLFLAHLHAVCPYTLPFYDVRQEGQSSQDYHKSMGYKIDEDGSVEEQDKFLHRMSGVMRLYCACMVATPPKGEHPHGVEHAWMWLCRALNMEPQPDITAAMIFDVLSVTGYILFSEYKIQFVKLLHLIYKVYLPKMKSVSITNSIVGRLEIFLENTLKNNAKVEPPKGLLPPNFWFS